MIFLKDIDRNLEKHINRNIEIAGWIKNSRFQKNLGFIELNDGTQFSPIQIVVDGQLENYDEVSKLHLSSAIIVYGKLVRTPNAKQPYEIQARQITVEGKSTEDYPLQKKRHTFEFLRTIQHLRSRTNTFSAVFKVRSELSYAIHKFFNDRGFVYIHTPIITGSDAEGAGEMFEVSTLDLDNLPKDENGNIDFTEDFFGKKTSLTVSGQLQVESFAMSHRNVYTFGPTFRAENSNTTRHAAEFWMVEPEIAFAELNEVCNLAEDMVKFLISYVLEKCPQEMSFFDKFVEKGIINKLEKVAKSDFKKMTYTEAIGVLEKSDIKFSYPVKWGIDLQTEHERYISEKVVDGPVFITDYPKDIKAFYMKLNKDGKTVAATDLLVPGVGEMIGGSEREYRYDILVNKIKDAGLNVEDYQWYLDFRKYGTARHGGYGLGFERMLMYITGITNIRDVIPFPRTVGHCEF